MKNKALFGIAGGLFVAMAMLVSGPSSSLAGGPPNPSEDGGTLTVPAQGFNPEYETCIGGTVSDPNVSGIEASCTGNGTGEDLRLGRAPNTQVASRIPGGTRQSLAFSYLGPGWRYPKEAGTFTCDVGGGGGPGAALSLPGGGTCGTQVGGIKSTIDLKCDGVRDVFADQPAPGDPTGSTAGSPAVPLNDPSFVPEESTIETTDFTANAGPPGQTDESFLNKLIPGTTIMSRNFRTRALAEWIQVGGWAPIDPGAPINFINLTPSWASKTQLSATFLAGQVSSPGTDKNCLDTPQNAIVNATGNVLCTPGVGCASASANPDVSGVLAGGVATLDNASGYYARWIVNVTAPDLVNGEIQGAIILNCKYVSLDNTGAYVTPAAAGAVDADAGGGDCLQSAGSAEPGRPVDPNDAVADIDGDGIPDGVEVAWGSCPDNTYVFTQAKDGVTLNNDGVTPYNCAFLNDQVTARTLAQAADTDQDGRTDLEELLANGTNLSNPRNPDTDGDGVNDGGIKWDWNSNGLVDAAETLLAGSTQTLAGSPTCPTAPCSPAKIHNAFVIPGSVIRPFEGDNCTNIANPTQVNSDSGRPAYTSTTIIAISGATDRSNPDEDSTGDLCDSDNDNDGMNDTAEPINRWVTGFLGKSCDIVSENGNAAAATDPTKKDSDNDGAIDGQECQAGTDPTTGCGPTLPCVGAVTQGSFQTPPLDAPGCAGPNVQDPCGGDDGLGPLFEAIERTTGINQAEGTLSCGAATGQLCDIDGTGNSGGLYAAVNGTILGTIDSGTADKDSDADGIKDSWEVFVWGTSPANQDTDNDGCPDGVEIVSATDPLPETTPKVQAKDFSALLAVWNKTRAATNLGPTPPAGPGFEPDLDYDGSGKIQATDFSTMLGLWNKTCVAGSIIEP